MWIIKKIKRFSKKRKQKKEENRINGRSIAVKRMFGSCGEHFRVFDDVDVLFGCNIAIGNNCKINHRVLLNGRSGITIGNDVTLSHGVKLLSTGYDLDEFFNSGKRIHVTDRPIHIGNYCWIGADAIVLPGVNISGEYVIVGAGAVVTKDITESRVLVAGNPAKIIKRYNSSDQENK